MIKELRSRQDGSICTEATFRAKFPQVIFPRHIPTATLATWNHDVVLSTPKPAPSSPLKQILRDGAIEDTLGNWVQAWKEVAMFTHDLENEDGTVETVAMQEEAYTSELEAEAAQAKFDAVTTTVDSLLNDKAKEAGYDNIVSACSYATSSGTFGAVGQQFVNWRDAVWTTVISIQGAVIAGSIDEPTLEELITQLPEFE